MAGGDPEYDKGAVSLEDNDKDTEQGGGKAAGVRIFLQIRRTVLIYHWCRNAGGYPPPGTGPRGFPRPGGAATDRVDRTAEVMR